MSKSSHDLIIENARIVDGTGSPWYHGHLGISDGEITVIDRGGDHDLAGEHVINVNRKVVAPGFIDTHSHSDLEALTDPTLAPKIRQGITTEILGQDGYSMAPLLPEANITEYRNQIKGLAGNLPESEWTWTSIGDYLDRLESSGIAPNVATLVGHGTVRFNILGMEDRTPTTDELAEMRSLVASGLEDGAVGLSTGLVYTPAVYSDTEEVRTLASELEPYGLPFVAHIRSLGRWVWDAIDEFLNIGSETGVPLLFSHIILMGDAQHGKAEQVLNRLKTARERGIDVVADQHPYNAGSTMLLNTIPPWVKSDPSEILDKLRQDEVRDRIRRDVREWRIEGWENVGEVCGWENVMISSVDSEENKDLEGLTIQEIAVNRNTEVISTVCDILVEEELQVSMILQSLYDEGDVKEFLQWEGTMFETDGLFGGNPHPRVYGSYPRILGHFVRDEKAISLEEAVRKMTSLPARTLGLSSKGMIKRGLDADLVIFDPYIVEDRTTYENPSQHPQGISHVLVNGTFVVEDGQTTGKTPGQALRSGE